MSGWISLDRCVMDHWVFEKSNYFKAWVVMIMEVNHKGRKVLISGELIQCDRGQSLNSLDSWSKLFGKGWTKQKVRTFFSLLKEDAMINTEGMRKTTRLTICNYGTYQNKQHRENTENNTETTQRQHAENTETTPNNNDNNKNNDNKTYKDEIKTVLAHLNANAGTKYRVAHHLPARFNEGYTVDDALKVVDNKLYWIGTEQAIFFRPETLFCKKHFDSYLNELPIIKKQNKNNSPINILHEGEDYSHLGNNKTKKEWKY